MTPDQKLALMALTNILNTLADWQVVPLILIIGLVVTIGPWLVVYLTGRSNDRQAAAHDLRTVEMVAEITSTIEKAQAAQEKRFEMVAQMYKDNVIFVQNYEKTANDLLSTFHLNIQGFTRLTDKIDNNLFCPIVRERGPKSGN